MPIRICHFSDWHGSTIKLPPADLYVCTGDMMSNYPVKDKPMDRRRMDGTWGYRIDPDNERIRQGEDVKHFIKDGGYRLLLGSPDAPIVCVRGNHDFIDIGRLFWGCNFIHEFIDNELIEVAGLRVTGHRGIPFIFGSWNDETQRPDLMDRVRQMPDADLFLTHYPPAGMLDASMPPGLSMGGGWAESYGLDGMTNEIIKRVSSEFELTDNGLLDETPARAAHCFGHIHECGGYMTKAVDVMFSNAATTVNVFEIEPGVR